jgi:hypothetical protein
MTEKNPRPLGIEPDERNPQDHARELLIVLMAASLLSSKSLNEIGRGAIDEALKTAQRIWDARLENERNERGQH